MIWLSEHNNMNRKGEEEKTPKFQFQSNHNKHSDKNNNNKHSRLEVLTSGK